MGNVVRLVCVKKLSTPWIMTEHLLNKLLTLEAEHYVNVIKDVSSVIFFLKKLMWETFHHRFCYVTKMHPSRISKYKLQVGKSQNSR